MKTCGCRRLTSPCKHDNGRRSSGLFKSPIRTAHSVFAGGADLGQTSSWPSAVACVTDAPLNTPGSIGAPRAPRPKAALLARKSRLGKRSDVKADVFPFSVLMAPVLSNLLCPLHRYFPSFTIQAPGRDGSK